MTGAATGTPRRPRAALLLAAAALLGSAACSDNPAPPPLEPDPSASTPVEPTDTPGAAPTLPPEARENTPAGAEAFVRYWVETLNYASATGDVDPLRDASDGDCTGCRAIANEIQRVYSDGGSFVGGEWTVRTTDAVPAAGGLTTVDAQLLLADQRVVIDRTGTTQEYRGGESFGIFRVRFSGAWRLVDLERPS